MSSNDFNLNELDGLREYLRQAITRADPSIDVSPGSPMDTEVITPLLKRLGPDPYDTPITALIRSRLQSEFPGLILQDGDPLDDYAVKIMRILLEPFRREIKRISQAQSVANADVLSDEEADSLAANFFVSRNVGGYATGLARLYCTAPQSLTITPSNVLTSSSGLRFIPVESQAITSDSMQLNTEGGLFYFDVVVRSDQQGSEYNIAIGEMTGISNVGNVVKVTNKISFEEGADRESTADFLARVEASLTEKSLVTARGINARIREVFANVQSLQVIGFGDPEMERDVITGAGESVTYAMFQGSCSGGVGESADRINLEDEKYNDGNERHDDFLAGGVLTGDTAVYYNMGADSVTTFVVNEVTVSQLRVTPNPPALSNATFLLQRPSAVLTLSNIPGGIVDPITPNGEITIEGNSIHIGGVYDVFVRAGFPQERSTTLSAIRDADPLCYGVELEALGPVDRFCIVTDFVTSLLASGTGRLVNLILKYSNNLTWYPTEDDVGRYLQLRGATTANHGIFSIDSIGYRKDIDGEQVVGLTLGSTNEETGGTVSSFTAGLNTCRVLEQNSLAAVTRDVSGIDFEESGVTAGDSALIETGPNPDIYSIRVLLDSVGSKDALLISQPLDESADNIRYRVADELSVDMVHPRTTKVPMGETFPADDLGTVANSKTVTAAGSTNFVVAGVVAGDVLEITTGNSDGTYLIQTVGSSTLVLATPTPATTFNSEFKVYTEFGPLGRPLVRVKEIELLDSSSQPTGVKIPYGNYVDARVLGTLSNRAAGNEFESYTGSFVVGTTLTDEEADFNADGINEGYRLTIYEATNAGEYVVKSVDEDGQHLDVYPVSEGGTAFRTNASNVHYKLGLPSTGFLRLYFLEPTTVDIHTGLAGGRLTWTSGVSVRNFMFSEVDGRYILPAPASGDELPRELRVIGRTRSGSGPYTYSTLLEFTDDNFPDVFDLELQSGDTLDINEPIPLLDSTSPTPKVINFYGGVDADPDYYAGMPGLSTVAGSDRVRVPETSAIDFTAIDTAYSLVGQLLYIEDGPDAGSYTIERVVDAKTLQLDSAMAASTAGILAQSNSEDIQLVAGDLTDDGGLNPAANASVGQYVTLFEITQSGVDAIGGTFRITEVDADDCFVTLEGVTETVAAGYIKWIRTNSSTNIMRQFHLYEAVPKKFTVSEVAPTYGDRFSGTVLVNIDSSENKATMSSGQPDADSVVPGDILEVMTGPNEDWYTVLSVTGGDRVINIVTARPFATDESVAVARVRGGYFGSRNMVRVSGLDNDGFLQHGVNIPYAIRRTGYHRVCTTEMANQFDGTLYYVDVQIESMGSGDDLNLLERERLEVVSGMTVDGYTYVVDNPVLSFSMQEQVSLKFDKRILPDGNSDLPENLTEVCGRNMKITYEMSPTTRIVDDLLHSDTERTINANPLARHLLPSYVLANIQYSGGSSASVVGPDIEDMVNTLSPQYPLEVSDVEALITRRGATYVKHPIELVSVTHDLDRNLVVQRSDDQLGGADVPYNGTARTSTYFAKIGEGLTVVRG